MTNLKKLIFEDEPVVGIKSPLDYPYVKILKFFLSIVASWPKQEMGFYESKLFSKFLKCFCLSVCICCWVGSSIFIYLHSSSLPFMEIGHLYLTTLMNIVMTSRVVTLTYSSGYRTVVADFITKTHLFFYKEKTEYAMKIHKEIHKVSHILTLVLTAQMICGCSLFNLISMYSNLSTGKYREAFGGSLKNSTFEQTLYFSYPFNTSTKMRGYVVACIIHWWVSLMCSIWFCMFDLFICLMVFQIWGHFKILIHKLNYFPKPGKINELFGNDKMLNNTIYTKSELPQVFINLKECIDYHREVKAFADRMSDVFGPTLFLYYMFHGMAGCLLLLECSQMTAAALIRYGPLTLVLAQQFIQLSIIFELVGTESGKLMDAIYDIPWESMDVKNRKIVAFFIMNVQKPVHVKALGIANVGVTSMATILKTSLSYFMFLYANK